LIKLDADAIHEQESRQLVGRDHLEVPDYDVVGHVQNTIFIQVSGDKDQGPTVLPEGILEQITAEILAIETLTTSTSISWESVQSGGRWKRTGAPRARARNRDEN
jgi:hypothetical protein